MLIFHCSAAAAAVAWTNVVLSVKLGRHHDITVYCPVTTALTVGRRGSNTIHPTTGNEAVCQKLCLLCLTGLIDGRQTGRLDGLWVGSLKWRPSRRVVYHGLESSVGWASRVGSHDEYPVYRWSEVKPGPSEYAVQWATKKHWIKYLKLPVRKLAKRRSYETAFPVAAVKVWISLTDDVVSSAFLSLFCRQLKTFCLVFYFLILSCNCLFLGL